LDVADGNAVRGAPFDESLRGELGPVVHTHARRAAVEPHEVIEDADYPRRNRCPDLDRELFAKI
jgi:hypothetical protein